MIYEVKIRGSTPELLWKLFSWSTGEESGIPSVAVKCVDIIIPMKSASPPARISSATCGSFGQFLVRQLHPYLVNVETYVRPVLY